MRTANHDMAVTLCRLIETFAPQYGCHVALTGGCLYKNGDRKDIDVLFYRIRQVEKIDHDGLKMAPEIGTTYYKSYVHSLRWDVYPRRSRKFAIHTERI